MTESASTVEAAIKFALAQVGKPYRWGGVGPNSFDCSGLMWRAYQAGGVDITRTAGTQRLRGTAVTGDWLPGDLIFPRAPLSPSGNHVVMYIGGGRVVEAPRTGLNVRVADPPAKSEIVAVRRMVKTQQSAYAATYQKAGFGLDDAGKIIGGGIGSFAGPLGGILGGGIGGAAGDIAGDAKGAYDAATSVVDAAAFLIQPHNWFRMAMFVMGLALIWTALAIAARGAITGALGTSGVKSAALSAAKGAMK